MTTRRRALMVSSAIHGRLPTGFKEVEWLQGTGTQYCITDVYPVYDSSNFTAIRGDFTALTNQNSRFEISSYWMESTSHKFGVTFSYAQSLPSGSYAPTLFFRYGKVSQDNAAVSMNNFVYPLDIHYELNKTNIVHNGGTSNRSQPSTAYYTATKPIVIGGYFSSTSTDNVIPWNIQTRFKSFKIYNNNTLMYEFVPCYRTSDNKTGFTKITVADGTTEFFPNAGTDEWIIGTVVK